MGAVASKIKSVAGSVVHGVEHGVEAAAHAVAHVGSEVYHVAKEGEHFVVHNVAPIVSKVAGVVAPIVSQLGPEGKAIGEGIATVGGLASEAQKLDAAGAFASPEGMASYLEGPGLLGGFPSRKFGSEPDMALYAAYSGGEVDDDARFGPRARHYLYTDDQGPVRQRRRVEFAADGDVGVPLLGSREEKRLKQEEEIMHKVFPILRGHRVTGSHRFRTLEEVEKHILAHAREKSGREGREYNPGTVAVVNDKGGLLKLLSW